MFVFPNVFGSYDTRQLPSLKITSPAVDESVIMADLQAWSDYINEIADAYVAILAFDSDKFQGTYGNGTGGGQMQPYTERGETEATVTGESSWSWGLPIRAYRDRQIYTEQYIATKSLEQMNKDVIAATNRFLTTRIIVVLRALFGNTNYNFNDGIFPGSDQGVLAVKRLFNADGTVGTSFVNGVALALGTIQSYVPSTAASIAVAQFTLNRSLLRTRGFTGRVIHLTAESDADTIKAMAGFIPLTTQTPYVNVENGPQVTTTTAVVTQPRSIGVFSNGGASDGEVVSYPFWPAGYIFSYDATKVKPIGIRQHDEPSFRGWRLVQDDTKAAYGTNSIRNKIWEFIMGAGVVNRMNGVMSQATTGSYTVPTF